MQGAVGLICQLLGGAINERVHVTLPDKIIIFGILSTGKRVIIAHGNISARGTASIIDSEWFDVATSPRRSSMRGNAGDAEGDARVSSGNISRSINGKAS